MERKIVVLLILHFILLNPFVSANTVHFKMDITDDEISVGQETVVKLYAWAEGANSGNGIIGWQLDLMLNASEDGIVQITNEEIIEPYSGFYLSEGALYLNDPYSGAATAEGAFGFEESSDVGIGDSENYTLMANITVKALAAGDVSYELGSYSTPVEDNFYATLADDTKLTGYFESGLSQNELTVIPEPNTFLMFSIFAGFALKRRRKN